MSSMVNQCALYENEKEKNGSEIELISLSLNGFPSSIGPLFFAIDLNSNTHRLTQIGCCATHCRLPRNWESVGDYDACCLQSSFLHRSQCILLKPKKTNNS